MQKLKMHSPDLTQDNIAHIRERFPNCVTEAHGTGGKVTYKVDFDLLRQELAGELVEGPQERYRLDWPGKRQAMLTANAPIAKSLRPCREESVNFDTTENLYIEGDNLEVLKLLQENYLGKVKMIYIDPPYNTGNDFIYKDDFAEDSGEFLRRDGQYDEDGNRMEPNLESNGRFHSDWLSMLYQRLRIAKNLLTLDGVLFISIDDREVENLKKICNEVFGEGNFAASIPWQSRLSMQNDTDFSVNHEYILVYAKQRRHENRRLKENNIDIWYKHDSFVFKPLPLDKERFDNPDNDSRGLWKADPMDAPNVRPNLTYPITNPNTGEQHLPPRGRYWRFSPEKFSSALEDNRIIWGKNGTGRPQLKVFYEEKKNFGSIDNSWFSGDKIGTATMATHELQDIFEISPFDTPKPLSFIKKLCELGFVKHGDIILDFFSGSATSAHAVMQLNAEDGGKRKFIMVQLPEDCSSDSEAAKAGYKNICEIGKERIRRAGKKIKEEQPLVAQNLDIGFRVLKVQPSCMADVYYTPDEAKQDVLNLKVDNVKPGTPSEDILFQVLTDWGVELHLPIASKEIKGKNVFFVDENSLVACFDTGIKDDFIKELATYKPVRVVFRDFGFANDDARINAEQIFKQLSPDTEVRVL